MPNIGIAADDCRRILASQMGAQTPEEQVEWIILNEEMQTQGYSNYDLRYEDYLGRRQLTLKVTVLGHETIHELVCIGQLPNRATLDEFNLAKTDDGQLVARNRIVTCDICHNKYYDGDMEVTQDTHREVCYRCQRNECYRCDHCNSLLQNEYCLSEIYDEEDDEYRGQWCDACRNANNTYWDDDNEREYVPRREAQMQQYLNPSGVLACGNDPKCHECSESPDGICQRHGIIRLAEMEKEATTLWVYDRMRRQYHDSGHNRFKRLKYRQPNEHPYLYYGIELEVIWDRSKGDYDAVTSAFVQATGGMFVAEYDSSVDRTAQNMGHYIGAEFISRPTSYKKWIDKDTITKLENGMKVLQKFGAVVQQDIGCGLHIHMSKAFFEKNTKKKVKDIKQDMDWFFQYFQPEIEKFARRPYTQYCASKAFRLKNANLNDNNQYFGIKGKIQLEKSPMTVSKGSGITHHDCVIETPKTIEARVFRSTLDVKEIISAIEFCRGLAHAARKREGLTDRTFGDILFSKDDIYLTEYVRRIKLDTNRQLKNKLEVKI